MKRLWITGLVMAALITAAPATAQITLNSDQWGICRELQTDRGMEECRTYYKAKEAVMNGVIASITNGVTQDPGNESMLVTVASDILDLHGDLDTLITEFEAVLAPGDWTEDLSVALEDEEQSTMAAAQLYGAMAYLTTMLFKDVFTMLDAVDDFDAKAERLKAMGTELSMAYREAQNVLQGEFGPEIFNEVRVEFAKAKFQASTMNYTLFNIAAELEKVLEANDPATRFAAELDELDSIRSELSEDWLMLEVVLDPVFEDLETMLDDSYYQLEERWVLMEEETLLDSCGEPFPDLEFGEISTTFTEMYKMLN